MGNTVKCNCCQGASEKDFESSLSRTNPSLSNILSKNAPVKRKGTDYTFHGTYSSSSCKNGFGIIEWTNSKYVGFFKNNEACGLGIYTSPDSGRYAGEYEDDRPNGYGIYTHITDNNYEGEWKNEKQSGIGIETWKDGSVYTGEFIDGKKQGIGKYSFPNGDYYIGEFCLNEMNGYGIFYFETGDVYMGEWVNGMKYGYGEIYGVKGTVYCGIFKNNIQDGFFIYYNYSKEVLMIGFKSHGKLEDISILYKVEEKSVVIRKYANGKKEREVRREELSEEDIREMAENKKYINYFLKGKEELEEIAEKKRAALNEIISKK